MHPNGQIPAYEWNFEDVNPPVIAWACYRVFKMEHKRTGKKDLLFLSRMFHKLLLNFTWWVNRKDNNNHGVFEGGFLGLDNIGVFDRNMKLPNGARLAQSDATSWMAMFCLNMLTLALELAIHDPAYEDTASKFFEHFIYIAEAMNKARSLWCKTENFYFDSIIFPNSAPQELRIRSLVGLLPILAVTTLEPDVLKSFTKFRRRMEWFIENRPQLCQNIDFSYGKDNEDRRVILSLVPRERLVLVLEKMLAEDQFLSPYGIRSLSLWHRDHPFDMTIDNQHYRCEYWPGESQSRMFGGNSNWRGPIWFPTTYLLIEALQKFDFYYSDALKVACPTGSGKMMNLWDVSLELQRRMLTIFRRNSEGRRPVFGTSQTMQTDPHWKDNILFYEYIHGCNGTGLGASHQTGWTGLVAKMIDQLQTAQNNSFKEPPTNGHK